MVMWFAQPRRTLMAPVLLVDDDRADLMLLEQALSTARPGLEVLTARTKEEMLGHLDAADLVLLDLNMPGTSGFELLEAIRSGERSRLPVIILTTSAAKTDVTKAYEVGANAFITKPEDLVSTIKVMEALCEFWLDHVALPKEH